MTSAIALSSTLTSADDSPKAAKPSNKKSSPNDEESGNIFAESSAEVKVEDNAIADVTKRFNT
ncbi:MAG: hypothetical protein AAFW75_28420, partial [Cyanobacteria bacterium J06636_16]